MNMTISEIVERWTCGSLALECTDSEIGEAILAELVVPESLEEHPLEWVCEADTGSRGVSVNFHVIFTGVAGGEGPDWRTFNARARSTQPVHVIEDVIRKAWASAVQWAEGQVFGAQDSFHE